jgi:hypothetical protein
VPRPRLRPVHEQQQRAAAVVGQIALLAQDEALDVEAVLERGAGRPLEVGGERAGALDALGVPDGDLARVRRLGQQQHGAAGVEGVGLQHLVVLGVQGDDGGAEGGQQRVAVAERRAVGEAEAEAVLEGRLAGVGGPQRQERVEREVEDHGGRVARAGAHLTAGSARPAADVVRSATCG